MAKTTVTSPASSISDLISVYGDLLHSLRTDMECGIVGKFSVEAALYYRALSIYHGPAFDLIKAAPDLLKACEELRDMAASVAGNWENGDLDVAVRNLVRVASKAAAAIAKARGKAA